MGKKSKNPFSNQTKSKQENVKKILEKIGEDGATAKEIREDTSIKISEKTINRHLKEFLSKGMISFSPIGKKYTQTKKGKIELNTIAFQKLILDTIIDKSGDNKTDYSELRTELENCSLAWGIESNLIMSKKLQDVEFIRKRSKKEIKKIYLHLKTLKKLKDYFILKLQRI